MWGGRIMEAQITERDWSEQRKPSGPKVEKDPERTHTAHTPAEVQEHEKAPWGRGWERAGTAGRLEGRPGRRGSRTLRGRRARPKPGLCPAPLRPKWAPTSPPPPTSQPPIIQVPVNAVHFPRLHYPHPDPRGRLESFYYFERSLVTCLRASFLFVISRYLKK